MTIPFNKMFFAQNVMPELAPEAPEPDPGDPNPPLIEPCVFPTAMHPFWKYSTVQVVNSDWFGFSMIPSGYRHYNLESNNSSWHAFGRIGTFWLSTGSGDPFITSAYSVSFRDITNGASFAGTGESYNSQNNGRSIRLVRDLDVSELNDPDGTLYINDYRDGSNNEYDGVRIGNLIWLTKNLYTKHFQNGNPITQAQTNQAWSSLYSGSSPGYCVMPHEYSQYHGMPIADEDEMIQYYGCLYNWYVIAEGIVAEDYRVPSLGEWTAMRDHLVSTYEITEGMIGTVLKSCRQQRHPGIDKWGCAIDTSEHPRWATSPDTYQKAYGINIYGVKNTLQSGFVPSGLRTYAGGWQAIGINSITWTTSKADDAFGFQRAWCMNIGHQSIWDFDFNRYARGTGLTIRGIRNAIQNEIDNDRDGTIYIDDYTDGNGNKYNGIKLGMFVITDRNLYATVKQNGDGIEHAQLSTVWEGAGQNNIPCWSYIPPDSLTGVDSQQDVLDCFGYHYNYMCVDPDIGSPLINQNNYRIPSLDDLLLLWEYLKITLANIPLAISALKSCRQVNHPLA